MVNNKSTATAGASAYSETEWDQAFRTSLHSSAIFIVTRTLTLAVMFWLMARAINQHEVSATVLMIPWAAQWLTMLWGGLILGRWVITCAAFRHDYASPVKVLTLSFLIFATLLAVIWFDSTASGQDQNTLTQAITSTITTLKQSDLWIVVLIEIVGVAAWVWPDIRRWRRGDEKFIWQASIQQGCRGAALFFLSVLAIFVLPWFTGAWFLEDLSSPAVAWSVWGVLLAVELLAMALGTWIHRGLTQQAASTTAPNA